MKKRRRVDSNLWYRIQSQEGFKSNFNFWDLGWEGISDSSLINFNIKKVIDDQLGNKLFFQLNVGLMRIVASEIKYHDEA